ncbi:MAG: hypothetical protein ACTSRP_12115 [Candidatus Helarchaeota archaeon]
MELNYSDINISKPDKSIANFLKIKNNRYKKNQYLIELIDYGMSLLRQDDIELKINLLASLIENKKSLTQLTEEFGKSSNLLRAIYELLSTGFISQTSFSSTSPGNYKENEYVFDIKKLTFKLRKNLTEKKQILQKEKELFENKFLFCCEKCKKTYDYIEAISNNFRCCSTSLKELNKTPILDEINKKIELINEKLAILEKI